MAASAGIAVELAECPLLLLPPDAATGEADARVRVLAPDDPDLGQVMGAVHAGFDGSDDVVARPVRNYPELIEQGLLVMVAAYDERAVRAQGVDTVLLSAGSDDAASIYRQVGFVDVGTACILEMPADG